MTEQKQFRVDESTQPIPAISIKRETPDERFQRLKWLSDVTGKRFVQVYLEDERRRRASQR